MRLPTALLAAVLAAAMPAAVVAADGARGRILYEARCDGCHAESVHGRARRAASDYESVRAWVRRWSANVGTKWSAEEVDDVAAYLNGRYYKFTCPPSACPSTSGLGAPPYIVGSR